MNFSKKNHEHKKTSNILVSKTLNFTFPKISITFLMCIAFALTITSCQKSTKCLEVDEKERAEMINHIISLDDAAKDYKRYGKSRNKILKDTLKKKYGNDFEDTRMVWFDIETIKQYILYVEEKSKDAGVDPEGLQFYFTVNSSSKPGKEKNHQTFFIAPTKTNDKTQSGYTISNGKVILLKDKLKGRYEDSPNQNTEKAGFFALMLQEDGLLLNGGNDSPPNGNN